MRRRYGRYLGVAFLLLVGPGSAMAAPGFVGTYSGEGEDGNATLKLDQDAQGKITGTFTWQGTTLQVAASVEGGKLVGSATLADTPVRYSMTASRQHDKVILEVTELDENGAPDAEARQRFTLARTGGGGGAAEPEETQTSKPTTAEEPQAAKPAGAKANPLAARADPYAGTYRNKEMTVVIKSAGGQYQGTITLEGKAYPFTARKADGRLSGTFKSGGDSFEFTAALAGTTLKLTTGGVTHTLAKQGAAAASKPANPLAARKPANPLAGGKAGTSGASAKKAPAPGPHQAPWKVLRHPVGIAIRYPAAWTAKHLQETAYQLVPPKVATENGQPTEAYFIMGAAAGSFTRPDDPQLLQLLEGQVTQLAPFLQRSGDVEQVKAGDEPGAVLSWEGANQAGKAIQARMYVVLLKGFAVCLFELGHKERVAARDKEVRAIFATLGASQESLDPKVAGSWRWMETRSGSTGSSMQKTQSVGENRASLVLDPGGAARRSETYQFMASSSFKNSGGQSTGSIHLDSGPQTTVKNGRWYAGEGRLVLLWSDDTAEEYSYQVQGAVGGRRLVLKSDKGSVEVWGE